MQSLFFPAKNILTNFDLPIKKHYFDRLNDRSCQTITDDVGNTVAADDDGNVYVGGRMDDGGGQLYFIVIKYDSAGNELWNQRYAPNMSTYSGEATKLVVHDDGVVVAGHVDYPLPSNMTFI